MQNGFVQKNKPIKGQRVRRDAPADGGKRSLWIVVILVVWMFAIIGRLTWLQVVRYDHYAEKAQANHRKNADLMATRGAITDRNGTELAVTLLSDSLFVDQKQLKDENDRRRAASMLAPVLGAGEQELLTKLTGDNGFVWLKRKLDPTQSNALVTSLEERKIPGLTFRKEPQRFYPNDSLAAHLLGYVGVEDMGHAGLEQKFNDMLTGKPGKIEWEKDAAGRKYSRDVSPAENGAQITMTIDAALQHKVEVLLDEAVRMTHAKGASAIVVEPSSGEILALANFPTFSPNERIKAGDKSADETHRQNRAVSWPFEPGSVFKVVAYSGAIEEGLARPEDLVNCGGGEIAIGKRVIHDTHAYGVLSVADAFAKSSNVGAIRMAQKLGKEKFFDYVGRFGFGKKTGIELPGESRGIVHPLGVWRPDSIGSIAIGQEVTVTMLQAVSAMSTIANQGQWVQPHVVKQVVTQQGKILYEAKPETRQVIKPETAATMTSLLEGVVTKGTARHAIKLNGYTAAGKTGTPQKAVGRGGYSGGKFMPTFAGFVPANKPRFAIIVMIDEPLGLHQGGSVAAPVFNLIAEAALGDFAVPPDDKGFRESLAALSAKYEASAESEDEPVAAPIEITKASPTPTPTPKPAPTLTPVEAARNKEQQAELKGKSPRTSLNVSANITRTPAVKLPLPQAPKPPPLPAAEQVDTFLMPDLRGRGVRAVMQACAKMQLTVRLNGSGVAVRQFPAAGARVKAGDACKVDFE